MTKLMRYTHWCEATHSHDMIPTPDGEYVKWDDVKCLIADEPSDEPYACGGCGATFRKVEARAIHESACPQVRTGAEP